MQTSLSLSSYKTRQHTTETQQNNW